MIRKTKRVKPGIAAIYTISYKITDSYILTLS